MASGRSSNRGYPGSRMALVSVSAAAMLVACTVSAERSRSSAVLPLPISLRGPTVSLRVDSRPLARGKAVLTIHLTPRVRIEEIAIDVTSADAGLRIDPPRCRLDRLSPPQAIPARGPPYALPAVPICSFVLSATGPATVALRIRIRDARGRDLFAPIDTMITTQGVPRR